MLRFQPLSALLQALGSPLVQRGERKVLRFCLLVKRPDHGLAVVGLGLPLSLSLDRKQPRLWPSYCLQFFCVLVLSAQVLL